MAMFMDYEQIATTLDMEFNNVQELQRQVEDLSRIYDNTLDVLVKIMELRDIETKGHSERVTDMTLFLSAYMGVPDDELPIIRRGAVLHDIGKLGVPDKVLFKPGPLIGDEWDLMKKHPEYAFAIIMKIEYLKPSIEIPYFHHEKWDGTGYPQGVAGKEIPLCARIFSVVDVWDALRSVRPYKKAWSDDDAYEHIVNQSRKHFDPAVVSAFQEIMDNGKAENVFRHSKI